MDDAIDLFDPYWAILIRSINEYRLARLYYFIYITGTHQSNIYLYYYINTVYNSNWCQKIKIAATELVHSAHDRIIWCNRLLYLLSTHCCRCVIGANAAWNNTVARLSNDNCVTALYSIVLAPKQNIDFSRHFFFCLHKIEYYHYPSRKIKRLDTNERAPFNISGCQHCRSHNDTPNLWLQSKSINSF